MVKEGRGRRRFWDKKLPGGENSWAAMAYQASLRAKDRASAAEDFAAKAETHELVARTAASQAHAAQLQVEFVARAAAEQHPRIKAIQEYCRKAKGILEESPQKAQDADMMRIRTFCSTIDESLDNSTRSPSDPNLELGYDLFVQPAKEYPVPPPMPDGRGFDPRVHDLPLKAQAKNVQKASMPDASLVFSLLSASSRGGFGVKCKTMARRRRVEMRKHMACFL
jgi:hypothetical protein